MITKLIRNAIKPYIEELTERIDRANKHDAFSIHGRLKEIEYSMNKLMSTHSNLADRIVDKIDVSTIGDTIDPYDIASHIEVDASEINLRDLADHITDNIEINASDIDIDYRDLGSRIASEIYSNDRLDTLERKMDLILNHLGIGAEDLLVFNTPNEENT